MDDSRYFVARCFGCGVDLPFADHAERERWVAGHRSSTGHRVIRGRAASVMDDFEPELWLKMSGRPGWEGQVSVRFDASGNGHAWQVCVGNVIVWIHTATDGPMELGERMILRGLVDFGPPVLVEADSEAEFTKAVKALREDPAEPVSSGP